MSLRAAVAGHSERRNGSIQLRFFVSYFVFPAGKGWCIFDLSI